DTEKMIVCLNADQPLSGWSRHQWKPFALEIGPKPFLESLQTENDDFSIQQQVRALEILSEVYEGLPASLALKLANHPTSSVRARAIWALSNSADDENNLVSVFAPYLNDPHAQVVHQALLRIKRAQLSTTQLTELAEPLTRALGSGDRYVRRAAIDLLKDHYTSIAAEIKQQAGKLGFAAKARIQLSLAEMKLALSDDFDTESVRASFQILKLKGLGPDSLSIKLDACRLIQIAWGDCGPADHHGAIFDGYASQRDLSKFEFELDPFRVDLAQLYPTEEPELDHEILRLISMVKPSNSELLKRIVAPINDESDPSDDIHRLIVASRIEVEWSVELLEKISRALVMLEVKVRTRKLPQDLYWNDRMKELYGALVKRDPRLPIAVVQQPEFGLPGHVVFMSEVPEDYLNQSVEAFVKRVREDEEYPWNNDVIFVLGESSDPKIRELIRERFEEYSTRQAVIMLLAENPLPEEIDLFIQGLEISHLPTLGSAVDALAKLELITKPQYVVALFQAARRLDHSETEFALRNSLMELLQKSTQMDFGFQTGEAGYRPQPEVMAKWEEWLLATYPEEASGLKAVLGEEETRLMSRLENLDWSQGDPERGRKFFEKRGCAQCHGGSTALGPDLRGVTSRFSQKDLFTAILFPDRDVSPRYQTINIVTDKGLIFTGLIIYESIDGMILRDGLNRTHRIETENVESRTESNQSLMPSGLLKNCTEEDMADLYTYLQSLQ
ncbi:MAG: c-type cytochrome, partial [Planctomycetaceae bacterium]|nr:c-type cytochrome [Planctomycetaceae bacterium]